MIRLSYAIWTAIIYLEILAYTLITQMGGSRRSKSLPIFALMATLLLFISFLFQKFSRFKTVIFSSVYSIAICIFLVLEIFEVVDSTFVNYGVAITACLVSFLWCFASHYETKTDPSWHYFVFASVFIIAVCAAFNFEDGPAQTIFVINTVLVVLVQIVYIWMVMRTQASGHRRRRHLIRVLFVGIVAVTILLSNVLKRSEIISFAEWEQIVLWIEIIIGFALIIDFCSTPTTTPTIKYTSAFGNV